jgi:hypothetical protein
MVFQRGKYRIVLLLMVTAASCAFAQEGVECRFWSKPYVRSFPLRGGYKLRMTHLEPAREIG